MSHLHFSKLYPLPNYDGPRSQVYRCVFGWTGSVPCFVRKVGKVWETAEIPLSGFLRDAKFSASPVAGASASRYAAVMAFDYYHNTMRRIDR